MNELLKEFLTEANDAIEQIGADLVQLESNQTNIGLRNKIFRTVHIIKGTCRFLSLTRLESLMHALESLLEVLRNGVIFSINDITLILQAIDRMRDILVHLQQKSREPSGDDQDIIAQLAIAAHNKFQNQKRDTGKAQIEHVDIININTNPKNVSAINVASDSNHASTVAANGAPHASTATNIASNANHTSTTANIASDSNHASTVAANGAPHASTATNIASNANHTSTTANIASDSSHTSTTILATNIAYNHTLSRVDHDDSVSLPTEHSGSFCNLPELGNEVVSHGDHTAVVYVRLAILDRIMEATSELILIRNQIMSELQRFNHNEIRNLHAKTYQLHNLTSVLQENIMRTRMQPISRAWQAIPRLVRDLEITLNKKIHLKFRGHSIELDRQVIEILKDSLVHIVRNAADHGIESPVDRLAVGKPGAGNVCISAYNEGSSIIIEISDDGRGLDLSEIRRVALSRGLATASEINSLMDQQLYNLLFVPGFSTTQNVNKISGRGVGLDALHSSIQNIGGTVTVHSVPKQGTTLRLKVPLTLALMSVLTVKAAGISLAVPQQLVQEVIRCNSASNHKLEQILDALVLRLRGRLAPVICLQKAWKIWDECLDNEYNQHNNRVINDDIRTLHNKCIIIVNVRNLVFGIIVDEICGSEEIMIKPVSRALQSTAMFAGNAILGDGTVALIIDLEQFALLVRPLIDSSRKQPEIEQVSIGFFEDRKHTTSLLLFDGGDNKRKAIPLAAVDRLIGINSGNVQRIYGKYVTKHDGRLVTLLCGDFLPQNKHLSIILLAGAGLSLGLVAHAITDIVDVHLKIEILSDEPGVIGSAIVNENTTEIIDIDYLIREHAQLHIARHESSLSPESRPATLLLSKYTPVPYVPKLPAYMAISISAYNSTPTPKSPTSTCTYASALTPTSISIPTPTYAPKSPAYTSISTSSPKSPTPSRVSTPTYAPKSPTYTCTYACTYTSAPTSICTLTPKPPTSTHAYASTSISISTSASTTIPISTPASAYNTPASTSMPPIYNSAPTPSTPTSPIFSPESHIATLSTPGFSPNKNIESAA